jgi:NDP-sugar pyrophosphorylase family protein
VEKKTFEPLEEEMVYKITSFWCIYKTNIEEGIMRLKTAIVLAGGMGVRLRPYTNEIPKPMIEIDKHPILYWVAKWLQHNNIKRMIIGVAYKKEKIIDWVKNTNLDIEISISEHFEKSGTGGGFKHAIKNTELTDDHFLCMNGDELTDLSIDNMFRFHQVNNRLVTILATPLLSNFGVLEIGENNIVTKFREKPIIDNIFMNSGIYIFRNDIDKYLMWEGSIERDTFRKLSKESNLIAFRYFGFWRTINTEKDLEIMQKEVNSLRLQYDNV